jgi:hypothetical protein
MTVSEALAQIEHLEKQLGKSAPISQQEVACPEIQAAVRVLATAYERVRKHDPLYGDRRRAGFLSPPPGRVLPG